MTKTITELQVLHDILLQLKAPSHTVDLQILNTFNPGRMPYRWAAGFNPKDLNQKIAVYDYPKDLPQDKIMQLASDDERSVMIVPAYTRSLDAAVEIIEKNLPNCYWEIEKHGCAFIRVDDADIGDAWQCANAPIAAMAALCKALVEFLRSQINGAGKHESL